MKNFFFLFMVFILISCNNDYAKDKYFGSWYPKDSNTPIEIIKFQGNTYWKEDGKTKLLEWRDGVYRYSGDVSMEISYQGCLIVKLISEELPKERLHTFRFCKFKGS